MAKLAIGEECPRCRRVVTSSVLQEKYRRRVENARASLAKAKANGTKIGRPMSTNYDRIRSLRKAGLSIRAIAAREKTSTATVQRALK